MNLQAILRNSKTALFGTFGREISVKPSQVSQVKSTLRQSGCTGIRDSPGNFGNIKIWFNPRGWNL